MWEKVNMTNPLMFDQGMLTQQGNPQQLPYNVGQPILNNPSQPQAVNPPALSPYGNARGSSRTPQIPPPNQQINMGGEGLMRIGMAGLGAGAQGPLAQMGAMGNMYGGLMDYNRQREMEAFEIEEGRRVEEQRRADIMRKLNASNSAAASDKDAADPEAVGEIRMGIAKLQAAKDMFTADTDSSLTGFNFTAAASRLAGRFVGNEDEAKRLFLQEVRLDSVMKRVAQTKGAISNAEMQLFASQAPSLDSNGVVWKSWLDRQLALQQILLDRMQSGNTIAPDAPLDPRLGGPDTSTPAVTEEDLIETDRIVNGG